MTVPSGANPSGGGQEPPTPGGQVPPSSEANGQEPNGNQGASQQSELTPEQMKAIIRQLRDNEAAHRKEKQAWEAAKLEAERAQMTAAERAKAEAEDYKKQLEQVRANARRNALEAAIANESRALGIVYPDVAFAAIEHAVSYGEDDKPLDVGEKLRVWVQAHPLMTSAAAVSANTSVANAPRKEQGVITVTREQRQDMRFLENLKKELNVWSLSEAINKGLVHLE